MIIYKGAMLEKPRNGKVTQTSHAVTTPGPEEKREGEVAGTRNERE